MSQYCIATCKEHLFLGGADLRPFKIKTRMKCVLFMLCLMTAVSTAQAQINVAVATEPWDRIVYVDAQGKPQGPIVQFVQRMNDIQSKFHFDMSIYPRLRLDQVFMDKAADVYPLRTTVWTNPILGLLPTKTILASGDVYFAKRHNRFGGAKVFADLKAKNIAGVRGYHYRLFNNNPDENFIKKNFNAYLLASNDAVIKFIMAGHADVGIAPEIIIAKYLADPKMRTQIIVGDEFDSHVELSNLVRKDGPITVKEMDAIIDLLIKSGDVATLKSKLIGGRESTAKK